MSVNKNQQLILLANTSYGATIFNFIENSFAANYYANFYVPDWSRVIDDITYYKMTTNNKLLCFKNNTVSEFF